MTTSFDMTAIKSVLILLRFPFSLFLLPIYLLALAHVANPQTPWVIFFVLHVLVYPSSNAYNSLIDQDTESVGGIVAPPPPPPVLGPMTWLMDVCAVGISFFGVRPGFAGAVAFMILMSRLYSAPWPRLKQYPVLSFLMVCSLQGAFTFLSVVYGLGGDAFNTVVLGKALLCSALVGSAYPLSQVFQHKEDAKRGDMTLSRLLGYRGTFVFSGVGMLLSTVLIWGLEPIQRALVFVGSMLPAFCYLCYWMKKVWQSPQYANFSHSLKLNLLWATGLNVCFGLYLII